MTTERDVAVILMEEASKEGSGRGWTVKMWRGKQVSGPDRLALADVEAASQVRLPSPLSLASSNSDGPEV